MKKMNAKSKKNIKESFKLTTLGFTLVELLAVIVILAIILVIAVPKVMSVIEDAKKATLESTAKMIASQAEKAKVQNTVLGKTEEITCESVAKINNTDYASCNITFENNTAKVTIEGSGKFDGLYVCNGTKTEATTQINKCGSESELSCALDEQKEMHAYVHPYEVNDVDSCVSFLSETFGFSSDETDICNGEPVEGVDFDYIIKMIMQYGIFTEEELVEANVIKPKSIVEVELCMPKKPEKISTYITKILKNVDMLQNGLVQTNVEYNGTDYDAGLRYVGAMSDVKNKVYYNCEDIDTNGVAYGKENYDYANSCEVWRIIGVFDTKKTENGSSEKRVKITNTESTFEASWDSSYVENYGYGINQWGESTLIDGSVYAGADLMQLLNGFYIGKEGAICTYCNYEKQATCSQTCTRESLKSSNMKVLTNTAMGMIENAVWDTYGVDTTLYPIISSNVGKAYLQEKGISTQYTGKICSAIDDDGNSNRACNDTVERTTTWTGLVGLMSASDIAYANGWLYIMSETYSYPWSITPVAHSVKAYGVWRASEDAADDHVAGYLETVFPSVYLKSDVKVIGGNGGDEPYKLNI